MDHGESLDSACADRTLDVPRVVVECSDAFLTDRSAQARGRVQIGVGGWQRAEPALASYVSAHARSLTRLVLGRPGRARFELSCEDQRDVLRGLLANLHGHAPALAAIDAWLSRFTLNAAALWITIPCCPDARVAEQLERAGLSPRQCAALVRTECGPAPLGWVAAADPRALDRARELCRAAEAAPVRVIELDTRTSETFPNFFRAAKAAMQRARAGAGTFDVVVSDFTYVRVVRPGLWFGRWPADSNDAIQKR